MLRVSFRNLLVRDAFKVVHLELAMSRIFWYSASVVSEVILESRYPSLRQAAQQCSSNKLKVTFHVDRLLHSFTQVCLKARINHQKKKLKRLGQMYNQVVLIVCS